MIYRNCLICGKKYEVCPTCEEIKTFTPWRTIVCDPQEYMLYQAMAKYNADNNAEAAIETFEMIGLTDEKLKTYRDTVQSSVGEIYAARKKNSKSFKKITKKPTKKVVGEIED